MQNINIGSSWCADNWPTITPDQSVSITASGRIDMVKIFSSTMMNIQLLSPLMLWKILVHVLKLLML